VGLLNRELAADPPAWLPDRTVALPVTGANRAAWAAAVNTLVPAAARRVGADVLWCPANFGPVLSPVPVVLTVHDLLPLRHPELVAGGARAVQLLVRTDVCGARHVIADSRATAAELTELLGVPADRVTVVPLAGPLPMAVPPAPPAGAPFLLSTGNRLPHNNYEVLLRALALLPPAQRPLLVVPGSDGPDPLRPLVDELGLTADVELLGWVNAVELDALYCGATVYVATATVLARVGRG